MKFLKLNQDFETLSEKEPTGLGRQLVENGPGYFVTNSKKAASNNSYGMGNVLVNPSLTSVMPNFVSNGTTPASVEIFRLPVGEKIEASEAGLESHDAQKLAKATNEYVKFSSALIRNEQFRNFLKEYVDLESYSKMQLDSVKQDQEDWEEGQLVRLDVVSHDDGKGKRVPFICDPNLQPLGAAFNHFASTEEDPSMNNYLQELGRLAQKTPNNICGIVTTIEYGNWSSHEYVSRMVRTNQFADNFYMIPPSCIDSEGRVDKAQLMDLYDKLGLPYNESILKNLDSTPGTLVSYVLECPDLKEETKLINADGMRARESQLFMALARIDGIENILAELGVQVDLRLIRESFVPTAALVISGGQVGLIKKLKIENGAIVPEITLDPQEIVNKGVELDRALYYRYAHGTEPAISKRKWILKSPYTTGSKGVSLLDKEKAPGEAFLNQLNAAARDENTKNGILLLQPVISSVVHLPEEQRRFKGNVYLIPVRKGNNWETKVVGVDIFSMPKSNLLVHGSSGTLHHEVIQSELVES